MLKSVLHVFPPDPGMLENGWFTLVITCLAATVVYITNERKEDNKKT
jgi:hypothetical protein